MALSKNLRRLQLTFLLILSGSFLFGQLSDFQRVYQILQTNCANPSCHGGTHPLDFSGTESDVYNALVGQQPLNPTAQANGNFLVDPGHPYNSFLLRKVGDGFDYHLDLETTEGNRMPSNGAPALDDVEIEQIRQWILFGANQSGVKVDSALIADYYGGNGLPSLVPPPPPADTEGFQLRFGPIFLEPNGEVEYLKKEALRLPTNLEVDRMDASMNSQSHHFLLFKFDDVAGADAEPDGLREVNVFNNAFDGAKEFTAVWQYSDNVELPQGTAFYWNTDDWLDFNYHIKNYSADSVLAADFYINVYTKPQGTGAAPMQAKLVNNNTLFLLPGTSTVTMDETWGGSARLIWQLSSHTHKYGTDYDIFVRNPGGGKGDQIYEGFFNVDYTFNQGYYDWEHPATRLFDPLYRVDETEGLIAETKYNVTQSSPVFFGLTTNDEMQLFTYLYVDEADLVGVEPEVPGTPLQFMVFPNPLGSVSQIQYFLPENAEVSISVTDLLGRTFWEQPLQAQNAGSQVAKFPTHNWESGIYFVNLEVDGRRFTRKVIR